MTPTSSDPYVRVRARRRLLSSWRTLQGEQADCRRRWAVLIKSWLPPFIHSVLLRQPIDRTAVCAPDWLASTDNWRWFLAVDNFISQPVSAWNRAAWKSANKLLVNEMVKFPTPTRNQTYCPCVHYVVTPEGISAPIPRVHSALQYLPEIAIRIQETKIVINKLVAEQVPKPIQVPLVRHDTLFG